MTYEDLLAAVRKVTANTHDEEIVRILNAAEGCTPRQVLTLVRELVPRWGTRSRQGAVGTQFGRLLVNVLQRRLHRAERWVADMADRIADTQAETLQDDLHGWVGQILRSDDPDKEYGSLLVDDLQRQRLLALLARQSGLPLTDVMAAAGRQRELWGRYCPDTDAALDYLQDQLAGHGPQVLAPWQIMELTRDEDDDPDDVDELQRRKRRRMSAYVSMIRAGVPLSTVAGAALVAVRKLLDVDTELGQARWVASRPPQGQEGGATA